MIFWHNDEYVAREENFQKEYYILGGQLCAYNALRNVVVDDLKAYVARRKPEDIKEADAVICNVIDILNDVRNRVISVAGLSKKLHEDVSLIDRMLDSFESQYLNDLHEYANFQNVIKEISNHASYRQS